MLYDIILQNNASREFFLLKGLEDVSTTNLYLQFDEVELPSGMPDGEYTYAAFINERKEVTYTYKTPLLDTLIHTGEGDVVLRDIQPFTGLLRVGEVEEENIYPNDKDIYLYPDENSTRPPEIMDYVHSKEMGNSAQKYLTTSIYPTLNTRAELKCKYRGYTTGAALVGNVAGDSKDWRLLTMPNLLILDISYVRNLRIYYPTVGETFTLDFGNHYLSINGNTVEWAEVEGELDNEPIKIDMGVVWVSSLKLWEGETLVFDGVAARRGREYGIWDRVSGDFLTDPALQLVGEKENNEILYYEE